MPLGDCGRSPHTVAINSNDGYYLIHVNVCNIAPAGSSANRQPKAVGDIEGTWSAIRKYNMTINQRPGSYHNLGPYAAELVRMCVLGSPTRAGPKRAIIGRNAQLMYCTLGTLLGIFFLRTLGGMGCPTTRTLYMLISGNMTEQSSQAIPMEEVRTRTA